jgi:hypothetical protein
MLLISNTFISCEAEKDVIKSEGKMIVKRCSMKDAIMKSNMKISGAVDYIKRLQTRSVDNETARLVYDEKSGLYYDDEKGLYVTKDEHESYIFPIIQTNAAEKIKNITFSKNAYNEYDIYIVKYDYSKEDLNIYSKEELAQREVKYQPLLKNGVEYPVETQWTICINFQVLVMVPIDQGELTGNFDYEEVWVTISSECFSNDYETIISGGSTGGSTGYGGVGAVGGDSNTPTNNNSSSNSELGNTILTALVIDEETIVGDPKIVSPTVNIKRLKKLTDNERNGGKTIFKQKIDEYKEKLSNQYIEEGMMYGSEFEPIPGESTKNSTEWSSYPTSHYVAIHMHQNKYYVNGVLKDTNPVMSDVDVIAMLGFYNYTNNINVTSVLVSRQGTFALRVNNGNQVNDAINALDPDSNSQTSSPEMEKFVNEYDNNVQNLFEAGNEPGALAGLINLINTYQINGQTLGISIFQAVFDSQGNITNWIKL